MKKVPVVLLAMAGKAAAFTTAGPQLLRLRQIWTATGMDTLDTAAEMTNLAEQVTGNLAKALLDPRLVDEAVACFTYSGSIVHDQPGVGKVSFDGQGAVKRKLSQFVSEADSFEFGPLSVDRASQTVNMPLVITVGEVKSQIEAELEFSHGSVSKLTLTGMGPVSSGDAAASSSDGPKWTTNDGRVTQYIWQHQDYFAPGSRLLLEKMQLTTGRLIAVIDATVFELYGPRIEAWCLSVGLTLDAIVRPGNEDSKTFENAMAMLDELKRVDPLRRSEPVLAIGGGVLTDVAGFACALWRRGIPYCRMPTTLLGMVDASVGIKVAVNYHRKNGVGHFFSPSHTFIDSTFLPTVSKADIRSGVGEIMKAALVHDGRLFTLMQEHGEGLIESNFAPSPVADQVVKFSVDTMLTCIGPDLWEDALLRPMDFGHSLSRTLEASENFKLRHGEAVAIDCIMSCMIAKQKGLMSPQEAGSVLNLYARLGLPCSVQGITASLYKQAVREITVHRDGILRAPLPRGIGKCAFVDEISDAEVDAAFAELEVFMKAHPETYWDISKSFSS